MGRESQELMELELGEKPLARPGAWELAGRGQSPVDREELLTLNGRFSVDQRDRFLGSPGI